MRQNPLINQMVAGTNISDSLESPPSKLAKILSEISPSVSIIQKTSTIVSPGPGLDLQTSAAEQNAPAMIQKKMESKRRDPCPCEYCKDPKYVDMRLHKCYVDSVCDKTFSKIAHLKAHIRCHNNERPFICDWLGCGKTFVRSDELKRHAWIHTKEDRFKCPCGKGYSRADHFRAHAVKCDGSSLGDVGE